LKIYKIIRFCSVVYNFVFIIIIDCHPREYGDPELIAKDNILDQL